MIRHKQLYRHNPATGEIGDCFRTCLACVLDAERVEDIPHFFADVWPPGELDPEIAELAITSAQKWLLENSAFGYIEFPLAASNNERLFKWLRSYCSDRTPLIVGCTSKNGGHAVVVFPDGEIWDPSLDNSGMVGPMKDGYYWIGCVTYRGRAE